MTLAMGTSSIHPMFATPWLTLLMCRIQFSRARRSAVRAKKAFSRSGSGPRSVPQDTTARTENMIKIVKRRRKQRYHRLREMIQSSDDADRCDGRTEGSADEIICPVCLERVFGDPDVTEAHVDACLVHAMPSVHEETELDIGGPSRTRVTDGANLTGLAHPTRNDYPCAEPFLSQLQASMLETWAKKMSKTKSTSTGTTRWLSAEHSLQK